MFRVRDDIIALSDLVVGTVAINPQFVSSNLAEGDGFLKAMKICSMPVFGGEVKS
jgi:hypothetical protein